MAIRLAVVFLSVLGACRGQQSQDYKDVNLPNQGIVRGVVERSASSQRRTIVSFRGIPYARPLNESSRFMPPEDPERFRFNLDAFQSRPCLQISPYEMDQVVGSEDCLTLDIYALDWNPLSTNIRTYPVVVYLPGGQFRYGSSATFGPKYLLDQDLILVIVNYRLGALGFLSTEDGVSPGNYGLMDQQKALLWIKANVHLFGGDREKITLFGHDSGAASIALHLLNSKSNDLFKQAVLSGGSVLNPWAFHHQDASKHATNLGNRLGCDTSSSQALVNCLRKMNPEDIVRETYKVKKITFLPVVDKRFTSRDPFVEDDPIEMLLQGKARPVPLILGMTKDEGSIDFFDIYHEMSAEKARPNEALIKYFTPYLYPRTVFNSSLPVWKKQKLDAIAKGVLYIYFKDVNATDWSKSKRNWIETISDFQYRSGMETLGRLVNLHNLSNTFMYQFEFTGPLSFSQLLNTKHGDVDEYGTVHMDDAFYYFNTSYDSRLPTSANNQIAQAVNNFKGTFKLIMYHFANDGHLGRLNTPYMSGKWPGYGPNETVMRIRGVDGSGQTTRCEPEGRFRTHKLDFFSSFVKDILNDDTNEVYYEDQETNEKYKSATWGLLGLALALAVMFVALAGVFIINKRQSNKETKFRRLATAPSAGGQEMKRT